MKIIWKETLESTNTFAEQQISEGIIKEPSCIVAGYQSAGKGQGSNNWESERGKNLTFSIICFPGFLRAEKQFYLNKVVALSVFDLILQLIPDKSISIKWPNDIYIENEKVAGMLIQAAVQKEMMKYAIIGIGLNVNQKEFPDRLPNPTSIIRHINTESDLEIILKRFLEIFQKRFEMLLSDRLIEIDSDYLQALYRFGLRSAFEYQGQKIYAIICGVNEYGWLQMITDEGKH